MDTYVAWSEMIQFVIMLTAVVTLCYLVFHDKRHKQQRTKITAQLPQVDGYFLAETFLEQPIVINAAHSLYIQYTP